MRGKTYAPEFKLKLVQQVLNGEKRPAQPCREHNIVTPCVHRTTKPSCLSTCLTCLPIPFPPQLEPYKFQPRIKAWDTTWTRT